MHVFNSSQQSKINDRKKQKTEVICNMSIVLWAPVFIPSLLKCKPPLGSVLDHI